MSNNIFMLKILFRMEDLNEMIAEGDDAFFNVKQFRESQILTECFRPINDLDYYYGKQADFKPKEQNEIRFVGVDYAFANSTNVTTKNANTIIICVAAVWEHNHFVRRVDYIEGWSASDSVGACDRARVLWYDYDADYFVPDGRSGGEVLFNRLTEELSYPMRGADCKYHGLTVSDKLSYHVVSSNKLDDYRQRTIDKYAIPCVIPILAQDAFNSSCWFSLRKQLDMKHVQFLISMQDYQNMMEDNPDYYSLAPEEVAKTLEPYGQTDMLIIEAVNLHSSMHGDKIKLTEPRNATKDRIVILSYVNYIIDLIENDWNRSMQSDNFNINDFQFVY